MTYKEAKTLHNEDEVIRKSDNRSLFVVSVNITERDVVLLCGDGNEYHHTDVA